MAKVKLNTSLYRIATAAVYLFLIGALGTYFVPMIRVHVPVFGTKSWSVRDVVKAFPKGVKKGGESRELTADYDFIDLVKELSPKRKTDGSSVARISPEFILGALVPVALALAYLLTLLNVLKAPLRKATVLIVSSALAAFFSCYVFVGVKVLDRAAQQAFQDSLAKVAESPFSVIAKNLIEQVTLQPDTGLISLILFTLLVFGTSLYRATKSAS